MVGLGFAFRYLIGYSGEATAGLIRVLPKFLHFELPPVQVLFQELERAADSFYL